MLDVFETLWNVSGSITAWRHLELVCFAIAVWACRQGNVTRAVEMMAVGWTVAAVDATLAAIGSFEVIGPPGPPRPFEVIYAILACYPLPAVLTVVLVLLIPSSRARGFHTTWPMKGMVLIPLIAHLDLCMFSIFIVPSLLHWREW